MKSECIFLTHNKFLHDFNVNLGLETTSLLWNESIQEEKVSQYGGVNVRYKHELKSEMIDRFSAVYKNYFGNTIRYIF